MTDDREREKCGVACSCSLGVKMAVVWMMDGWTPESSLRVRKSYVRNLLGKQDEEELDGRTR